MRHFAAAFISMYINMKEKAAAIHFLTKQAKKFCLIESMLL